MNPLSQPNGFAIRWANKIGDFFCLSLVFLLCCLPLITIIPACIALYDTVALCIRSNKPHPCKHFFSTLRREILRGILLTVLWVAFSAMLFFGYGIINTMEGTLASFYATLYMGTMLIPLAMLTWLIPLQSRFAYSFFELHKASLVFSVTHLPTTAVTLGILFVSAFLLLIMPVLVVLLPAIMVTVQSLLIEKVLIQYMPEPE